MCNHINVLIEKVKETPKVELYSSRCIRCCKESLLSMPNFKIIVNVDENDDGVLIVANTLNHINKEYDEKIINKYEIEKSKNIVNEIIEGI